jgi:AcrR family transcriptional regulator
VGATHLATVGVAMTNTKALQRTARDGRTSASEKRRRDIPLADKILLFEGGYQLASVNRIAAAGTTTCTAYDHFGSKDGLLAEVATLTSRELTHSLRAPGQRASDHVVDMLKGALRMRKTLGGP